MKLDAAKLANMIDLSCVRAESSLEEIREAAETARKYNCICVFALPAHTPLLVGLLEDRPDIHIGGAVGFPDGGATTAGKVHEARELVEMGVDEIDMVLNIGWLKNRDFDLVAGDISAVIDSVAPMPVKVILECHHLNDDEIIAACGIAADCGAQFVKTGTGWAPTGATLENIRLMAETVGTRCGVKAAGGVRDRETLVAMYEAGATRFGIGVNTANAILAD